MVTPTIVNLQEKEVIVATDPLQKDFYIFIHDYCSSCLKSQVSKSWSCRILRIPRSGQKELRLSVGLNLVHLGTEECLKVNPMMNGLHKISWFWSTSKLALNSSLNKRSEKHKPNQAITLADCVWGAFLGSGGGF